MTARVPILMLPLLAFSLVASLFLAGPPVRAATSDLFFSEYVEGSGLNKALEIYNGTGAAVDLGAAGYTIDIYFNGSSSPGTTITLTGTVADGDVYVVADDGADPAILAIVDQTSTANFFNGDDAVVLRKSGVPIDAVGQVGVDPGSQWGSGETSTQNNTLRRRSTVCSGDGVVDDAFDPATEWEGFAEDVFDGLGSHSADCGGFTPIYDIQFTTAASGDSPLVGQTVTTRGTVTALFSGGDRVFIQDGNGSWRGLFLFQPDTALSLGDRVQVEGQVSEYFGLTEIADGQVTLLSAGNPVPAPTLLATGDVSQEQWESVLVRVEGVTVSTEPDSFGEWMVDDGSGDVVVDDLGSYTYAPQAGDQLEFVQGPLNYSFGAFKIEPRDNQDLSQAEVCGDPYTAVYTIQGSGSSSPLDGTTVSVEGVVVGDFQASNQLSGFFIQDPAGDGDAATSDGLFVFAPGSMDVAVGDAVRLTGRVDEYFDLTEITDVSDLLLCGSGIDIAPVPITLPVESLGQWERYEGMLVAFPQTLTVTENFDLGRYGELGLSANGRLFNPTNVVEPGPAALELQERNDRSRIQLDDASTRQNPVPLPPYFGPNGTRRAGDTTQGLTGILSYSFGSYEVQPTQPVDFTPVNARRASPADVGGNVTVASFNVLNYFTTVDNGQPICGPSDDLDCRGADSQAEFERQRAKIVNAILALDADVVGLIELENNSRASLQDLVDGLNTVAGAGTYAFVDTGTIGTDAIKVGLIYKPAKVTPLGDFAILDSSLDARFIDTKNRPVLAQTFSAAGEIFTVAVNHLKSKGSACDDVGDPDADDGQGNCNQTRTQAAQALVDWLAKDPTGSGDPDFLIVGDLNAYRNEDPIDAIEAGGYTDLIERFIGPDAYSYVFFGQAGYLDHALATPSLTGRVTGVTEWHINADEPRALDYNDFNQSSLYQPDPYRSSDHDPVLVGFCDAVAPALDVSVTPDTLWAPDHQYVTVQATVSVSDNFDAAPALTLLSVTANEVDDDTGDGSTANDIVIVDDFTFELRAERAGHGDGRVYAITYQATDGCGNSATATAQVSVAHDSGKDSVEDNGTDPVQDADAQERDGGVPADASVLFLPILQN